MIRRFARKHANPLLLKTAELRLVIRCGQVIPQLLQLRQIFLHHRAEFHQNLVVSGPQQTLDIHRPSPEHIIR
ncbi:hypothetical protein D3C85_1714900 [compost metagenome]